MNCLVKTSISGSETMSLHVNLHRHKKRTPNETVKYSWTTLYQIFFAYTCISMMHLNNRLLNL